METNPTTLALPTTATLPIAQFRDQIIALVNENPVVIITAETGAGKSTEVPQYLLDAGFQTLVTQPRRLAATSIAEYVAECRGVALGREIGYRIGGGEEVWSRETRLLYVTDGLALVRELVGKNFAEVIVVDEIHEWNKSVEVLVAWLKRELSRGRKIKVVLMSATIEADKLASYWSDVCGGEPAPVITVPGRLFPVEEIQPKSDRMEHIEEFVRDGHSVLVFEPGKAEISDTIADLRRRNLHAVILPLHGELESVEQRRCFEDYGRPKIIVSTNVAQTSVTIDGITAVVDSAMERRVETSADHVEGLYLLPISKADSNQRKGRAGRTRPGIYVNYSREVQPDFPKAEIERLLLDKVVLQLLLAGIDPEELQFFHQPDPAKIRAAKRTLRLLGCVDENNHVTDIGYEVNRLPVSVHSGRMIVEAIHRGVLHEILTIAAILEVGEMHVRKDIYGFPSTEWRRHVGDENESDLLAQARLYKAAQNMRREQLEDNGIRPKAYFQVVQTRRHLVDALNGRIDRRDWSNGQDRYSIIACIAAGLIDKVFRGNYGIYTNGDQVQRELHRDTFLYPRPELLVGEPRDFTIPTKRGPRTVHVVAMATAVTVPMLVELAPHLVEKKTSTEPIFDTNMKDIVTVEKILFGGKEVGELKTLVPSGPEYEALLREKYMDAVSYLLPKYIAAGNLQSRMVQYLTTAEIPAVVEHSYGIHPRTGERLVAYGTYVNEFSFLERKWFADKDAAEGARTVLIEFIERKGKPSGSQQVAESQPKSPEVKPPTPVAKPVEAVDLSDLAAAFAKQGAAKS